MSPNWQLPFEIMGDARGYVVGTVFGQRYAKCFYAIYYTSKVLNEKQVNYTTTEKELLALVFFWKFFACI